MKHELLKVLFLLGHVKRNIVLEHRGAEDLVLKSGRNQKCFKCAHTTNT